MRVTITTLYLAVGLLSAQSSFAQSFQADVHFTTSKWSEFDDTDLGIGGRLTLTPKSPIGIDADLTWYPGEQLGRFSRHRLEGLFGLTVGPKIDRVRPFVKAAAGFLKVAGTGEPVVCVAIFPPPLACKLAAGATMPAYEIGGGVDLSATSRTFVRADVGYRFLKYPAPTFDSDFQVRDQGWWGGALRFMLGAGFRF